MRSRETSRSQGRDGDAEPFPLVSGAWLVRWLAVAVGLAAVCGHLSLCLLFYLGQWQVVFHPSREVGATPATVGVGFDDVRFDYTETGVAQLDGWWIPAVGGSGRAGQSGESRRTVGSGRTILFLHDGRGSLSDSVAQLKALHSLGVNVFTIDYRGFGSSMNRHPSEVRVYEDADAAMAYLVDVRHIEARLIVVYGAGLGATIAAEAARRHPQVAGLVLEDPVPSGLTLIERDPRTRLVPVRLLFRDRFELAPKLRGMATPKLFLGVANEYFAGSSGPKKLAAAGAPYLESIRGFVGDAEGGK